ncbi:MAG: hypothetical protein ACQEXV_03055 [Bacillota bacterium]
MSASPAGDDQASINKSFAKFIGVPIITLQQAQDLKKKKEKNIVYRALNPIDVGNLALGKGIISKHTPPNEEWSLERHVTEGGIIYNGKDISMGFDPWISTTHSLHIAKDVFNKEGRGVAIINLNLVPSRRVQPQYEFWGVGGRAGEWAEAFGFAEQEVSVYKYIPTKAIVGYLP